MISISSPERVPQRLSPQQYHDVTTEFCKAAASGSNPSTIDLTNRKFCALGVSHMASSSSHTISRRFCCAGHV